MKYFIGLDIGGTKIEGILINQKAKVLKHLEISTPKNKKQFLQTLFNLIKNLKTKKISGIGIGAPGQIKEGIVIKMNNLPQIKKLNLKSIIQKKFKIKTLVDNDANCFALAESRLRKKKNLIGLTLGSGVGGGIIIQGRVYRGNDNLSGEFGQIKYLDKTYEDYCSGKFFKKNHSYKQYGTHLGVLLATIVNSFNPETIVLGGSITNSFSSFKKTMVVSFKKSLNYPQLKKTKILPSKLKHTGALGAAFLHNL